ncbi:MAG: hypothetical protein C0524_01500 [Rhodobacter sp.]|nr:hypothetical protein [Rhodobacter sp.]
MRRFLRSVLRLCGKEAHSLHRDVVMLALIAYAFTYAVYSAATDENFDVEQAAVAVVDDDRSALSRRLIAALQEPMFRPPVLIEAGQVDRAMDLGRYVFVIEIPPRFEADLTAGRQTALQINVDATAMSQAGNGAAFLQEIIGREIREALGAAVPQLPVDPVVRLLYNPNTTAEWFTSVMEIINMTTMLSVILGGAAVIRERDHGTIEHLLVMPVTPAEIMLSKILANGLVIVAAALSSLIVIAGWLLGAPLAGSLWLFAAGAFIYQLSVMALGVLLATFAGSMQQFGLLSIPVLVSMSLLSGARTPLESSPDWLQTLMFAVPSSHFTSFAQAVLYRSADLSQVWMKLAAMAATGAIFFFIALRRFRTSMTVSG